MHCKRSFILSWCSLPFRLHFLGSLFQAFRIVGCGANFQIYCPRHAQANTSQYRRERPGLAVSWWLQWRGYQASGHLLLTEHWWHSPEKVHTGKEEESFHCFHKTKKHNVGFGCSLTNHWKLHHYFCCSSELSNDSTQKEEHEVSMSAHQSSRRLVFLSFYRKLCEMPVTLKLNSKIIQRLKYLIRAVWQQKP